MRPSEDSKSAAADATPGKRADAWAASKRKFGEAATANCKQPAPERQRSTRNQSALDMDQQQGLASCTVTSIADIFQMRPM